MKNTTILFSALLLIILTSCDFSYSKSWSQKTLQEKENAKIELEIESKGYFSTISSGSADGEFLFQRIGSLKDVVKSFTNDTDVVIEGIPDEFTYNLKVTNYPSAQISDLSSDILDFMAEEAEFNWRIAKETGVFYSLKISNEDLLLKARDYQPGVKQKSEVNNSRIKFVGSLNDFISFLNKYMIEQPIRGDVPEMDFNLKFELPNGSKEELMNELENSYGISLIEKMGKREAILITAN